MRDPRAHDQGWIVDPPAARPIGAAPAARRGRPLSAGPHRLAAAVAALLLSASMLPALAGEGVSVTGAVDAHELPLGETLSYTVTVQGAGMSGVAPSAPSGLVNLQVVGGPGTSTQFSFVNGVVSSTRSYKWFLSPQAVGKARIPAQEVKVGDKIYRTEPIDVEVTPAGSGRKGSAQADRPPDVAGGRDPGSADLRIENELSAPKVYVGQPVILTTRLLSRIAIVDVSAAPDPTVPGFLLEESDTNVVPERVFREGREYQSYVLMRRILTPTSPGRTVIPSETRTIRVRAGGRDPFDSFFAPRVMELVAHHRPGHDRGARPARRGQAARILGRRRPVPDGNGRGPHRRGGR